MIQTFKNAQISWKTKVYLISLICLIISNVVGYPQTSVLYLQLVPYNKRTECHQHNNTWVYMKD